MDGEFIGLKKKKKKRGYFGKGWMLISIRSFMFPPQLQRWPTRSWRPCCPIVTFSCSTWEILMNTRLGVFQMLSTSHVSLTLNLGKVWFSMALSSHIVFVVCTNISGYPGGVSEADPRAISTEIWSDCSWERWWQHRVLLRKWKQECQSTFYCWSAGI